MIWTRRAQIYAAAAGLAGLLAAAPATAYPAFAQSVPPSAHGFVTHYGPGGESDVNVCSYATAPGSAHCDARARSDSPSRSARPRTRTSAGRPASPSATLGNNGAYDPSYIQSAYNLPSATSGSGRTVAIVDAYDDPQAEADLTSYRSQFGLSTCSTANGCFTKLNQSGVAGSYPAADTSWAEEISLDLDMVSAACPNCHIMLVEANSTSMSDLGIAVNTAVAAGAVAVSNSYGGSEWSTESQAASAYYNHPGVAITASAGDSGYGVEFPAAAPDVTAVGGTTLDQATNTGTRNATETVWSGTGSGCSAYEAKPSWQADSGCANRSVADVAADADPNTGVWVYDSYGQSGWMIFGGTSAASPIVASVYAMAGVAGTSPASSYPYANSGALNDITSGSNGTCSPTYLCTGEVGYDGPTGLGTPNGLGAFAAGTSTSTPTSTVTAPGAPTSVKAATAKPSGVNISWSAPASDGGAAISGYELYRSTASGAEAFYANVACTASSCSVKDTGTHKGTVYYYEVSAVNSAGTGTLSAQVYAKAA